MQSTIAAPAGAVPDDATVAFEELYHSSRDDLYAYVRSLVHNDAVAEDVTATAFERAYRRRTSFKPRRGSLRAWLFGIARNAALDELRRGKRTTALETEPADEAAAPDADADAVSRRGVVREALAGLSTRERELIALKFFAGLSTAEIASVIGTSESAAAMRVHRTIEKLRRSCDEA